MSIDNFINTLRVLAEGESQPSDTALLPTDQFNNRGVVIDSLVDIIELCEEQPELLYDILRWLIIIDTRIEYRFDPELVGTFEGDNEFTKLISQTYTELNATFSISQNDMAVGIAEGSTAFSYSGLAATLIQAIESDYSGGQEVTDRLRELINFHKFFCATNPSALTIWWADAVADVYNTTVELEDAAEMYDHTEDSVKDAVLQWYVANIPNINEFWDHYASVVQNFGPTNPITVLYEQTVVEMENVHNLAAGRSAVCRPAEVLQKQITTVEELFIDLLVD